MLVPSLLRRVERTCVGVALSFEIEDGVDSRPTCSNPSHDRILIRTHDIGDAVQHDFSNGKGVK